MLRGKCFREDEVRGNSQYLAANLKKYGWEYVVVDIQWYEPGANSSVYRHFAPLQMDQYSRLIPAINRFPSAAKGEGFKPLADYIHSLGLKFSGELRDNDDWTLSLLTNAEVLEVNQESYNNRRISSEGDRIIWVAEGTQSTYAALFNTGEQEVTIDLTWSKLGVKEPREVRDLWAKEALW